MRAPIPHRVIGEAPFRPTQPSPAYPGKGGQMAVDPPKVPCSEAIAVPGGWRVFATDEGYRKHFDLLAAYHRALLRVGQYQHASDSPDVAAAWAAVESHRRTGAFHSGIPETGNTHW